jgi:pimeloyl-ACP methyl ester carboxylesterase
MASTALVRVSQRRWFSVRWLAPVLVISLAAYSFFRPVTVINAYARVRLFMAGAHDGAAQAGPYRIHYIVAGSGTPVVLLHALGMDGLVWRSYITALARHYRVYAIDLLGFGDSDRPDVDYSTILQAKVVHDFLDAEQLQQVDLVGVSMGGLVALHVARLYPERVRRLIVADAPGVYDRNVRHPPEFLPQDAEQVAEFQRLMTPKPYSMPRFVVRDMVRRLRQQDWVVQRVVKSRRTGRDFLDGHLQNVNMPVLLLWGEQDALTPLSWGVAAHRQLPHSELVILGGCGHIALYDCREQALPEVSGFLLSAEPPRGGMRRVSAW